MRQWENRTNVLTLLWRCKSLSTSRTTMCTRREISIWHFSMGSTLAAENVKEECPFKWRSGHTNSVRNVLVNEEQVSWHCWEFPSCALMVEESGLWPEGYRFDPHLGRWGSNPQAKVLYLTGFVKRPPVYRCELLQWLGRRTSAYHINHVIM